jgi:hypothetical protein
MAIRLVHAALTPCTYYLLFDRCACLHRRTRRSQALIPPTARPWDVLYDAHVLCAVSNLLLVRGRRSQAAEFRQQVVLHATAQVAGQHTAARKWLNSANSTAPGGALLRCT